ncbi:MAG: redoxin domain-containing protein [Actinobacteria bacterium]|nr:redoxin domain-containing protein [Actinomycetota bacterium]
MNDNEPGRSSQRLTLLLVAVGAAAVGIMAFAASQTDNQTPAGQIPIDVQVNPNSSIQNLNDLAPNVADAEGMAPDFEVTLATGELFKLSEFLETEGKPVFLNLWASWCGPCRAEMPDIDEAAKRYPSVMFLGVAVNDDLDLAKAFVEQTGVTYPIAYDTRDAVVTAYPPIAMPATFIISSDGRLVDTVYGALKQADIDRLLAPVVGG